MEYLINGNKYNLSYSDLRERYNEICSLSLQSFLARIPEILHLSCMISFLKEVPSYTTLGDEGLIHELKQLLHIPDEPLVCAEKIKKQFEEEMKLV
jgi:hypothetical protein